MTMLDQKLALPSELFTINRFNAEADTAVHIDASGICQDPMYPTPTLFIRGFNMLGNYLYDIRSTA